MKKITAAFFAALSVPVCAHAQLPLFPANNPGFVPFGGDAETGVSSNKFYTHAVSLGKNASEPPEYHLVGVRFDCSSASSGTYAGFDKEYGWSDFPFGSGWGNNSNITSLQGSEVYNILYWIGSGDATMVLSGLTPGAYYEFSLFMRCYDAARPQKLAYWPGTGREQTFFFNHNDFTPAFLVVFRYQADENGGFEVSIAANGGSAVCLPGFMNEMIQVVRDDPATGLAGDSATLNAFVSLPLAPVSVTAHWGLESGLWDGSPWMGSENLTIASTNVQAVSTTLSGLDPSVLYVCRFEA